MQDSLPAAGPALPGGIGYPQGSCERFHGCNDSPFPSFLARCRFIFSGKNDELTPDFLSDTGFPVLLTSKIFEACAIFEMLDEHRSCAALKFLRPSFIRAVMRLGLGLAGLLCTTNLEKSCFLSKIVKLGKTLGP